MSKGRGSVEAAVLSRHPAKTPSLDSGLLRNHPHPTLAGAAGRTSGDSPMRARLAALEMEVLQEGRELRYGALLARGAKCGSTAIDLDTAIRRQYGESPSLLSGPEV